MRVNRLFALLATVAVLVAAAPIAAQETVRLDVQIHYSGFGRPEFVTSKPAYVAVFDVTRNGVRQLYPMRPLQVAESNGYSQMPGASPDFGLGFMGTRRMPYLVPGVMRASYTNGLGAIGGWSYAQTSPWGSGFGYGVGGLSTYGYRSTSHTVLAVASSQPLRVGSPWTTPQRLSRLLQARGFYFDVASDSAISMMIDELAPADSLAETVATWEDYAWPQFSTYADVDRYSLFLGCLNSNSFAFSNPVYLPTIFAWMCDRPTPPQEGVAPRDTTVADSAVVRLKAGVTNDPGEIRRIIQALVDADKGAKSGIPSRLGGAETATRFNEPRSPTSTGGGNSLSPEARSSARVSGPVDNARAAPSTGGPATIERTPRSMQPSSPGPSVRAPAPTIPTAAAAPAARVETPPAPSRSESPKPPAPPSPVIVPYS